MIKRGGMPVSIDWSRTTRSTFLAAISAVIWEGSRTERACGTSLMTTSWSPLRMNVRPWASASRSSRHRLAAWPPKEPAPFLFSSKILSQPWRPSLSSWVSRLCPTVEIRAYQIFIVLHVLVGSETASRDAIRDTVYAGSAGRQVGVSHSLLIES